MVVGFRECALRVVEEVSEVVVGCRDAIDEVFENDCEFLD
jgi:hypothetical protein